MKNTIFKKLESLSIFSLKSTFILTFAFSGFLSCVSIPQAVIDEAFPRTDYKPPTDAFGLVMTKVIITPDKCVENENFMICKEVIKNLPPIVNAGMGSGMLVKSKSKTIFLTAAHVCVNPSPTVYESDGVKMFLKTKSIIRVRNHLGEEIPGKIIKIDEESDLCALELEKNYTKPIVWSAKEPEVGDKVYAISAPHGINAPTMNLIFSGFYSGHIEKLHHYTIPTRPGSSGSVVLNKNFRGVGMLNAAYVSMESLGLGTGYRDIKLFLDSI